MALCFVVWLALACVAACLSTFAPLDRKCFGRSQACANQRGRERSKGGKQDRDARGRKRTNGGKRGQGNEKRGNEKRGKRTKGGQCMAWDIFKTYNNDEENCGQCEKVGKKVCGNEERKTGDDEENGGRGKKVGKQVRVQGGEKVANDDDAIGNESKFEKDVVAISATTRMETGQCDDKHVLRNARKATQDKMAGTQSYNENEKSAHNDEEKDGQGELNKHICGEGQQRVRPRRGQGWPGREQQGPSRARAVLKSMANDVL